jgi:hypothetical protein
MGAITFLVARRPDVDFAALSRCVTMAPSVVSFDRFLSSGPICVLAVLVFKGDSIRQHGPTVRGVNLLGACPVDRPAPSDGGDPGRHQ